jgi:hypothetical protein
METETQSEKIMHMTLDDLLRFLDGLPSGSLVHGFGEARSYRGFYDDVAFEDGPSVFASHLARTIRRYVLDQKFTGYKGGDYRMTAHTPVWMAEYGELGGGLVGFTRRDAGYFPVIDEDIY